MLALAQPALYADVRIAEPVNDTLRPMKSFLKTLVEHPALGEATQELSVIDARLLLYEYPARPDHNCCPELSHLLPKGVAEVVELEIFFHPLAIALLARLPNLRHLRYTAKVSPPTALLDHMHQLRINSSILSKLKTFHL